MLKNNAQLHRIMYFLIEMFKIKFQKFEISYNKNCFTTNKNTSDQND